MRHVLLPATQRVKLPSIKIDDVRSLITDATYRAQALWSNLYGYFRAQSNSNEDQTPVPITLTADMKKAKSVTATFGYDISGTARAFNWINIALSGGTTVRVGFHDRYAEVDGNSLSVDVMDGVSTTVYRGSGSLVRTLTYNIPLGQTIVGMSLVSGYGNNQHTNRGMRNFIFGF